MNKQVNFFVLVVLLIVFTGCIGGENGSEEQTLSVTLVIDYGGVIESEGVPLVETFGAEVDAGSTTFNLLNESTDLEYTEDPMYGAFITSINGVGNLGGKYWMFYVNGEMASVGVSSYVLQDGDIVTMKFEEASW